MRAHFAAFAASIAAALFIGAPAAQAEPGGKGDDRGEAEQIEPGPILESKVNYGAASWLAAHKSNYTRANRPSSHKIDTVVIHTMQGTYEGTKAWFRNSSSDVTTHYVMRSKDGALTQMVSESDIAWHAGNWEVNKNSIGIEHEGYVQNPDKWYTDEMYAASAALVRNICERYGIPMDRKHIVAHSEVPGATHTDPGKGWDWDRYMKLVRGEGDSGDPIALDNDDDRVEAGSSWKSDDAEGQYGADYRWAEPVAKSDPAWYRFAVPADGTYLIEVRYPAAATNNDRAPYVIRTVDGMRSAYVDQRSGGGEWRSIGVYELAGGDYPAIGVSRWTGGEGRIVADGIRITPQ